MSAAALFGSSAVTVGGGLIATGVAAGVAADNASRMQASKQNYIDSKISDVRSQFGGTPAIIAAQKTNITSVGKGYGTHINPYASHNPNFGGTAFYSPNYIPNDKNSTGKSTTEKPLPQGQKKMTDYYKPTKSKDFSIGFNTASQKLKGYDTAVMSDSTFKKHEAAQTDARAQAAFSRAEVNLKERQTKADRGKIDKFLQPNNLQDQMFDQQINKRFDKLASDRTGPPRESLFKLEMKRGPVPYVPKGQTTLAQFMNIPKKPAVTFR